MPTVDFVAHRRMYGGGKQRVTYNQYGYNVIARKRLRREVERLCRKSSIYRTDFTQLHSEVEYKFKPYEDLVDPDMLREEWENHLGLRTEDDE